MSITINKDITYKGYGENPRKHIHLHKFIVYDYPEYSKGHKVCPKCNFWIEWIYVRTMNNKSSNLIKLILKIIVYITSKKCWCGKKHYIHPLGDAS